MVTNRKPTGRASSMPRGLAVGAAVSMAITLVSALVMAGLLDAEKLAWENVGYGIMVMVFCGAFLGAVTGYHLVKRQRMVVCLMGGGIYFLMLLAVTALFFGGQYDGVGATGVLILGGSGCAALLGLRQGRGGRRRRNRRVSR